MSKGEQKGTLLNCGQYQGTFQHFPTPTKLNMALKYRHNTHIIKNNLFKDQLLYFPFTVMAFR